MAKAPAPTPSVGIGRLSRLRAIAGTGVWRTKNLRVETVDRAIAIVREFEASTAFGSHTPQPRVAPTDDGGASLEWENDGRELFLLVEPDGTEEWLLVDGTQERTEINADLGTMVSWLKTGK